MMMTMNMTMMMTMNDEGKKSKHLVVQAQQLVENQVASSITSSCFVLHFCLSLLFHFFKEINRLKHFLASFILPPSLLIWDWEQTVSYVTYVRWRKEGKKMLQNYDLEYHDFQYFWSRRVVCATDKRAAGLVQRTQGGGRHIRLEDHQLYYYLEFCRGTMYLISVNWYTIYIWCREGDYIYQKSKNVYKYPPFKLCSSKNH